MLLFHIQEFGAWIQDPDGACLHVQTLNRSAVMGTRGVICQKEMVIQVGGIVSESFIVIFSVVDSCQQHNWGEEKQCPLVFVSSSLNM